jgi:hypothetical protein
MGQRNSFKEPKMGPLKSRDPRHGSATGYSYWGCRCDKCRAAFTQSNNKSRAKKLSKLLEAGIHGLKTYQAGCHCDVCRAAARQQRAEFRSKRKKHFVPLTEENTVNLTELA